MYARRLFLCQLVHKVIVLSIPDADMHGIVSRVYFTGMHIHMMEFFLLNNTKEKLSDTFIFHIANIELYLSYISFFN